MKNNKIQWHPAFDAALQIELADDADCLTFEPEHLLSKKPMQMDELIIKKNTKRKLHKELGHIFLGHNVIEYKSPEDHLSINDFYKTYGYACFYQSDTKTVMESFPMQVAVTCELSQKEYYWLQHLRNNLKAGPEIETYPLSFLLIAFLPDNKTNDF